MTVYNYHKTKLLENSLQLITTPSYPKTTNFN